MIMTMIRDIRIKIFNFFYYVIENELVKVVFPKLLIKNFHEIEGSYAIRFLDYHELPICRFEFFI